CCLNAFPPFLRECHPEGGTHALRSQARFAQGRATEGSIQLLVIGAGVTDPSQVPMPCGHHRGMKMPPKRPPRDLFHRKLRMTSHLVKSVSVLRTAHYSSRGRRN